MRPNEIDTNQGQIIGTKHIKNFTTIDNLNENQYILAVSDELTGVGLKLSPRALSKTVISPVQGNGLIQDDDGLLYSNSAINKYDETITYGKGDWVLGSIAGIDKFYESLQDDNIGNPLSDTDYWQPVSIGGGCSSAGSEIGDIGTALFVDETQGKRRKLNGSILDINDNTQGFVDWLETLQSTNPEYFTTESNWQAESALAVDGCVYKFVLDEENATVRLPKYPEYVEINASNATVPVKGNGMTLGLTNGSANFGMNGGSSGNNFVMNANGVYGTNVGTASSGFGGYQKSYGVTTDASKSGIIADTSNVLKQTKLKLYYFIQIATGSETQVNIINDIELNNPFTLFDSKYSDHELFNASWLRSQGQYNSKAIYVKAYEALAVENNEGVEIGSTVELPSGTQYTKQGLSVKLSTETYTDYDFVLSTSDETFRLPLKSNLASGKAVVGNRMTLGLTDGNNNFAGLKQTSNDLAGRSVYGRTIPTTDTSTSTVFSTNTVLGITTDPTKSGMELSDSNLYLYYYIGETVQNASLIDAGRIMETYATKQFATSASFPSDRYIDLELGASGSTYTAPANGWLILKKVPTDINQYIQIQVKNNGQVVVDTLIRSSGTTGTAALTIPIGKNNIAGIYYTFGGSTGIFRFIYAQGEQ